MNTEQAIDRLEDILRYKSTVNCFATHGMKKSGGLCALYEDDFPAIELAISALSAQQERENPKPLTWGQLKERESTHTPVWLNKSKQWAFVASTTDEPYEQAWLFVKGLACTVLYYHEEFYDHEPKEARG